MGADFPGSPPTENKPSHPMDLTLFFRGRTLGSIRDHLGRSSFRGVSGISWQWLSFLVHGWTFCVHPGMFLRFHDQPSEVARCLDRRQPTLAAALRFHGLFPAFVFVDEPCDPVIHVDPFEHPRECPPDCVMERAARVHRSRLQRGVTSVIEAAVISDDPVDNGFPKVDFFDSGHEVIRKRMNKS